MKFNGNFLFVVYRRKVSKNATLSRYKFQSALITLSYVNKSKLLSFSAARGSPKTSQNSKVEYSRELEIDEIQF